MSLNDTPRANRLHIGIFGRRNAGKSSLINALTGQKLAIVSQTPGTTADPVYKAMELHPVGPVVFIDTAGFDDEGELGQLRAAKTEEVIPRTDVAIVVMDGAELACGQRPDLEQDWIRKLQETKTPVIAAVNKWESLTERGREAAEKAARSAARGTYGAGAESAAGGSARTAAKNAPRGASRMDLPVIPVSAEIGDGIENLRRAVSDAAPEDFMRERIIGDLVDAGGLVLLVMPQDIQAPKGRLILPQVQTLRELLDKKCPVMSTTADGLDRALATLNRAPDLIITDSQCFGQVYQKKPAESRLTSFSILLAASKGDIDVFLEGAAVLEEALKARKPGLDDELRTVASDDELKTSASVNAAGHPFRVLIAEACTHVPLNEDIGTVKIPRLLRKAFGETGNTEKPGNTETAGRRDLDGSADAVDSASGGAVSGATSNLIIRNVRGNDFPDAEELKQYDLIIHCGACMFNRHHVMSRIEAAKAAGVPITNYGIFLAKVNGILDKVSIPGRAEEEQAGSASVKD